MQDHCDFIVMTNAVESEYPRLGIWISIVVIGLWNRAASVQLGYGTELLSDKIILYYVGLLL
jgi:hypothetical protein